MIWISLLIVLCNYSSFYCTPIFLSCNESTQLDVCRSVSLNEELLPGTVVNTFKFMDPDVQQLKFSIILQGTNLAPVNYLSINTRNFSVDLVVGSRIDREDFAKNGRELFFTINALGIQNSQLTFYVNVIDIDDNFPVFVNLPVTCVMPELSMDATCANLLVQDPDNLNTIMYFNITSSTTGYISDFSITSAPPQYISFQYMRNYTIGLNTPLNYSVAKQLEITIQVMDSANHTTLNSIYIYVIDVPNNPPIFQNLPYSVIMNESLPQGTYVMKVSAIDGDTGINSPISYSFDSSPFNQYFAINSTTGVITIANVIIRESSDILQVYGIFSLTVIASKNETVTNTSQSSIYIRILDLNNQPAVFNQNIYNGSILANSALGTPVAIKPQIIITDKDYGANAEFDIILYQNDNTSNIFDIFPITRSNTIMLSIFVINGSSLNYASMKSINLTIEARQRTPVFNIPQSSFATVIISILNYNLYAPVFINSTYIFSIYENSAMYTKVGSIVAIDKDLGVFGVVSYQLMDATNKFVVNSTTGDIFVNVPANNDFTLLDREKTPTYYLFGVAVDSGGLIGTTAIVVNLLDVDDNPPVFQAKTYYGWINESSLNLNPIPLQVQAIDIDQFPLISYTLINITNDAQTFLSSFSINNVTGILTVVSPIDREKLNQNNGNLLLILVQAYDPNKLTFSDFCIVQIYVQDINDNAPILTSTLYNATISQNVPDTLPIIYVNATDLDQANTSNSQISYKLLGNDAASFVVQLISNTSKGASITKRPNATLRVRTYNFTVEADDCGFPPLSTQATVLIIVLTFNSRNPRFNQTLYQFNVNENVVIGTFIGQVFATDPDLNNNLTYTLSSNYLKAWNSSGSSIESVYNFSSTFAVNLTTGIITTMGNLDREVVTKIEVLILVVDNAADTANQTATTTVDILINDINDNPPIFTSNYFYLNILEDFSIKNNVTTGATGLFTTATDKDITGVLLYNYTQVNQSFLVDPVTAEIYLIVGLDREKVPFINFTVLCTDGVHWTSATVIVTVLDVNDNEPVFNGLITNITISQSTAVGSLLQRFNATDLDAGEYARLVFRINGGEMTIFAVSPDGNFTLAQSLLQNPIQSFVVVVEVYDNPTGPYHLRCDKSINIFVLITNSPPMFDQPSYQYIVPENIVLGFRLDEIDAKDNDPGQNGVVTYYFLQPPINANPISLSLFSMSVFKGKAQIFANSSLRYKAGQYIIILRAMDNGVPPLDSNCTLYINVTAVNYVAPNFTNPVALLNSQSLPVFSIAENVVGFIANISAYDPDEGLNGVVRYGLEIPDLDNANFTINSFNGTFSNLSPFIRLTKGFYYSRIKAYDLGTPSLSTYISVQIVVSDAGNKAPVFLGSNKTINLSINEGTQVIGPIPNTSLTGFKIGNVALATSYNLGINSFSCYFMMTSFPNIYLVPFSGDLYGLQFFDREVTSSYQSGIKAVIASQCNTSSSYQNTNYDPKDPSQAMLSLQILDINDNPPYFTSPFIYCRIPRGYVPGTAIIDFSQYSGDVDLVSQGHLTYSIQSSISVSSPLDAQMSNDQMTQFFTLNATSGVLSISQTVSFLISMQGYFKMTVAVFDGKFTNTTPYMTYLVSQTQRIYAVVQDYLPSVASTSNKMAAYFSQKLSVTIYIDGLELCSDVYMNLIYKCTNVYMYGFNTSSNMVLDGAVLLNMFSSQTANMAEMTSTYKVSNVLPASQNISGVLIPFANIDSGSYKLILIIVACICFLIIVITCAVMYVFRSNYQRKLKAYTTSSSDHTAVLKSMSIPGTNLYENSKNPFAGTALFNNSSVDQVASMKKYGVPVFGNGLTLEGNTLSMDNIDDETQIIDSTETIF